MTNRDERPRDKVSGTILLVCRANVARTPLATAMLKRRLNQRGCFTVDVMSAGTDTSPEITLQAEAVQVARLRGLDLSGHVIRGVDRDIVSGADLVLTMTEALRDEIARAWPVVIKKTFSIVELDRLLGDKNEPIERVSDLALRAHAARPLTPPASASEDVDDPAAKPLRAYERTADRLDHLVGRLADRITLHG